VPKFPQVVCLTAVVGLELFLRFPREKQGERERQRDREREKKGEVLPKQVPKGGCPWPGSPSTEMPNWLARHPHAKWRGAPVGVAGIPGVAL
jgi:hypothetical protein